MPVRSPGYSRPERFPQPHHQCPSPPKIFRGLLAAGASGNAGALLLAAVDAIAMPVGDEEQIPRFIFPSVFDPLTAGDLAAAVVHTATKH